MKQKQIWLSENSWKWILVVISDSWRDFWKKCNCGKIRMSGSDSSTKHQTPETVNMVIIVQVQHIVISSTCSAHCKFTRIWCLKLENNLLEKPPPFTLKNGSLNPLIFQTCVEKFTHTFIKILKNSIMVLYTSSKVKKIHVAYNFQ